MLATIYNQNNSAFQAVGGEAGVMALVEAFYQQMSNLDAAKVIRAMHADDLTETKDKLFCFLCGWMGGPKLYSQKYGQIALPLAHSHLPIGQAEVEAWLLCMKNAMQTQNYPEELLCHLTAKFSTFAGLCQNKP